MTEALERVFRAERGQIVGRLARRLGGDLELAEDAFQEATARAADRWPREGVPAQPGAWLTVVAWRRALDDLRAARPGAGEDALSGLAAEPPAEWTDLALPDDRLALILACAHPALAAEDRLGLMLRHVAGLSDREIAAALLVGPAALTKRLVRARRRLRDGGVSFAVPERSELPGRLDVARAVITVVFSEGHLSSGEGPAVRAELCEEAVWLARGLHDLTPDDAETIGLLALLLLHSARLPGRLDGEGGLVPFSDQRIEHWDGAVIDEALALLARTGRGPLGPFQVQAAIAAVQTVAARDGRPLPWSHISRLYAVLARLDPSPVVELNRAVAVGRSHGAEAGLRTLEPVMAGGRLAGHAPLHAAHADLLERAGRRDEAAAAWQRALATCTSSRMRAHLRRRARHVLSSRPDASVG